MQLGLDIQDNKEKPQVLWLLSEACHSSESTNNLLQISKRKPVAKANQNFILQEEAQKDFYSYSSSFRI